MAKVSKSVVALAMALFLSSCSSPAAVTSLPESVVEETPISTPASTATPAVEVVVKPWSDEDVEAMVLTLAGECYEDKEQDKRLVC